MSAFSKARGLDDMPPHQPPSSLERARVLVREARNACTKAVQEFTPTQLDDCEHIVGLAADSLDDALERLDRVAQRLQARSP